MTSVGFVLGDFPIAMTTQQGMDSCRDSEFGRKAKLGILCLAGPEQTPGPGP